MKRSILLLLLLTLTLVITACGAAIPLSERRIAKIIPSQITNDMVWKHRVKKVIEKGD